MNQILDLNGNPIVSATEIPRKDRIINQLQKDKQALIERNLILQRFLIFTLDNSTIELPYAILDFNHAIGKTLDVQFDDEKKIVTIQAPDVRQDEYPENPTEAPES